MTNVMTFTHGTDEDVFMTHLIGGVQTTRRVLEKAFGAPTHSDPSGDGKVTTEWILKFEDGTVATIYDWKRYEMGAPALDEREDWHIGGRDMAASNAVLAVLEDVAAR